ncbi:GGDEF domain-containing protein [Lichenicoccus roseus]|uniref:diguanylate cyclase n=1 Tax=Lichenicoccus roseus TaxID=2683649 RepID=A0A5R9JAL1_9PROT|nr:GGDEF domain-containing protein [Lichenicoccus roseus]TLU72641.1 GGDEF domain-containing protein [Lichenicoccus roseus]
MSDARYSFTVPAWPVLRWLTDPGRRIAPRIAQKLLGEIFASPRAAIAGVLNGLILNVTALCMHLGKVFAMFVVIDVALAALRIAVVRRAVAAAARNQPTPTELYLLTAMSWCALEGAMAFAAMRTGSLALQLLAATTVMGLVGPICARNYAAPRYAMTLVALCCVPFVAGGALSGNHWLLILVLQTPVFFFGVATIIRRFQGMAVATLQAEQESYDRARHDGLTGLLNRSGLMEALGSRYAANATPFVLFYLDLDGFKPINDSFGHAAGDRILRAVADRMRSSLRPDDIVSRLGGDEFVIVAPDMTPAQGEAYAGRVIRSVTDEPYMLEGSGRVRIGISVGFACSPEDGAAGDDLHRKADAALYEAKAAGRGIQRRFIEAPVASREVAAS